MNFYLEAFKKLLFDISPKIITALIILFVGLWVTSIITKAFKKIMLSRKIELTLTNFLGNLVFWSLRVIVFIAVVSKLGVETSSFVAILGAAGLAIGLSLQGSLSNFAGGILIILFKPFKLGDKIEVQGETGKVEEIQIFSTKITTGNNQIVYIPNGLLSNGKIKNFSQLPTQRTDFEIISNHSADVSELKNNLLEIIQKQPLVMKDPKPEIYISHFTDTSVNFVVKIWTNNSDATEAKSDILEKSRKYVTLVTSLS
jgi:small conductance mechanosensitive channel